METKEMKRTWTQVGEEHSESKQEELANMFDRLEWQSIPCTLPVMPGEGIKKVIRELNIPKADQVAYSHEMAPYGLMGIKAHYKNGDATIYICDEGCQCVILATDFYPN